jgi:hypothetical protein
MRTSLTADDRRRLGEEVTQRNNFEHVAAEEMDALGRRPAGSVSADEALAAWVKVLRAQPAVADSAALRWDEDSQRVRVLPINAEAETRWQQFLSADLCTQVDQAVRCRRVLFAPLPAAGRSLGIAPCPGCNPPTALAAITDAALPALVQWMLDAAATRAALVVSLSAAAEAERAAFYRQLDTQQRILGYRTRALWDAKRNLLQACRRLLGEVPDPPAVLSDRGEQLDAALESLDQAILSVGEAVDGLTPDFIGFRTQLESARSVPLDRLLGATDDRAGGGRESEGYHERLYVHTKPTLVQGAIDYLRGLLEDLVAEAPSREECPSRVELKRARPDDPGLTLALETHIPEDEETQAIWAEAMAYVNAPGSVIKEDDSLPFLAAIRALREASVAVAATAQGFELRFTPEQCTAVNDSLGRGKEE